MRFRLAAAAIIVFGAGSLAGVARAQPSSDAPPAPVRLEWAADEPSCPPLDLVRRQVRGVLGRDPFALAPDAAPGYVVSVRIAGEDAGWAAELELRDAAGAVLGSRTVRARARRCEALAESLGLVLAMVIDLSRRHAELTLPEPAPVAAPPAPPASAPPPAPRPETPRHTVSLALRTGPGAAIGLLAPLTLGYHLALIAEPVPWLGLRFSLDAFPSDFAYDAGAAVELRAATSTLDVCLRVAGARVVALSVCAGGVIGGAIGTGQNLDVTRTEGGPIAGAQGGLVLHFAAGREAFGEIDASLLGWVVRQDFGYLDAGVARFLREMPTITGLIRFSLGWRFVP